MTPDIHIDATIPIIATGQIGEAWAVVILEEVAKGNAVGSTDVLFLEEILDNYHAIGKEYEGKKIAKSFKQLMARIVPMKPSDFTKAMELAKKHPAVSPRDLMHAAIMINNKISEIISVDGPGYFELEGISRSPFPDMLKKTRLLRKQVEEKK